MDRTAARNRLLAAAATLVFVMVLQESLLRFAFPLPELENFNRINYMPVADTGRDVRGIRNLRVRYESLPDRAAFLLSLNEYGFRDGPWRTEKDPETRRLMFVGDSFVEGVMVDDDLTIPRLFQSVADEKGARVEAMNFGVTGSNWEMYMNLIADAVPWFRPDWVVLVVYARNFSFDSSELRTREVRRASRLRPRLLDLLALYRRGEMVHSKYSRPVVSFDQPVPHPANPLSDPEVEAGLRSFVAPGILEMMKRGGFNPYRARSTYWYEEMLRRPFDFQAQLAFIKETLERNNCRLLVAFVPERRQISNFYKEFEKEYSQDDFDMTQPIYRTGGEKLAEQCARMAIPFCDCLPVMEREEMLGNHLYWNYDEHLDTRGNELVARTLFECWARQSRTP